MSTENKPYRISGTSIVNGERMNFSGWAIESRTTLYAVRHYNNGPTIYYFNGQEVPELPNTPLVKQLLDKDNEK